MNKFQLIVKDGMKVCTHKIISETLNQQYVEGGNHGGM